jgi:hypothetical protein
MPNVVTLPALRRDIRVAAPWPLLVGGTPGVLGVLHGDRMDVVGRR